jgi:NAD-dependent deacetylase
LHQYKTQVHLITQNVDDLHEQAGSKDVIHLHGKIAQSKCFYNCQGDPTIIDISKIEYDKDAGPPPCPHCGRHVRPDVVWFGESLLRDEYGRAWKATENCAVMLVVGTSGLVSPASHLPSMAKNHGAKIVEVNPDETPITPLADFRLKGASGEMLPKVIEAFDALQK